MVPAAAADWGKVRGGSNSPATRLCTGGEGEEAAAKAKEMEAGSSCFTIRAARPRPTRRPPTPYLGRAGPTPAVSPRLRLGSMAYLVNKEKPEGLRGKVPLLLLLSPFRRRRSRNFCPCLKVINLGVLSVYDPVLKRLTKGMDGNKDEALRSVKLAETALASGDRQRAETFIRIAQRLDPSLPIDDILATPKKYDTLNGAACQHKASRGEVGETQNLPKESVGPTSVDKGYTEENIRVVRNIRKNKDYYAILGVERSCSVEEIRKAYRKLSLKVHPDKNKAPGAEDAFKLVSKAFKCLSNDQSRRNYDQTESYKATEASKK
ncbi:hypothetical protein E2562_035600 [Oryza meyeriana var. granulata]|uniref:J domain-containing protein n=1 Tax=Oryza meyeriana var. granulata TaxID=110450 RepID=A0A6G1ESY6_9ORYZ|nr:hypothetical protein E2562_035600 [Oryza meyeriana var. granulata]